MCASKLIKIYFTEKLKSPTKLQYDNAAFLWFIVYELVNTQYLLLFTMDCLP